MKTLNDKALENRQKAMNLSRKIARNYKVFSAPQDVKRKRAMMGTSCGALGVAVGGACFVAKSYTLAAGLVIGGAATLGVNLAMSKLNK